MKTMRQTLLLATAMAFAWQASGQELPTPLEVVRRACEKAGGLEAFQRLGFLRVEINSSEVTQDGTTSEYKKLVIFSPQFIVPVRLELPQLQVIAGDDGEGGWALAGGKPDPRPATTFMVRRMVTTDAFPLTLPFSLTWPGVAVSELAEDSLGGRPTWRLTVTLARNFFHTPQIATQWTVHIDKAGYQVLRAESPFTDLGKGVVADGMRFSWSNHVTVGGVRLPTQQLVVGLDASGNEKAHSRRDSLSWERLTEEKTAGLFENPIPPELRPRIRPMGKPVNLPQPKKP